MCIAGIEMNVAMYVYCSHAAREEKTKSKLTCHSLPLQELLICVVWLCACAMTDYNLRLMCDIVWPI